MAKKYDPYYFDRKVAYDRSKIDNRLLDSSIDIQEEAPVLEYWETKSPVSSYEEQYN